MSENTESISAGTALEITHRNWDSKNIVDQNGNERHVISGPFKHLRC